MFCPRCSNQIAENQNYCRNCGLKLHLIVDAIQDKPSRGQFDFETLKRDLRDLGSSLRAGFEEAIKNTRKLKKNAPPASQQDWSREGSNVVWSHEVSEVLKHHVNKALKKTKVAHSRKYSFQQAALSIFGGGATMAVWYYVLEAAVDSGLLQNLEQIIAGKIEAPVVGLVPVIRMLWMLGLIPVTRGVAHLINGIFFAPKPEKELEPQIGFAPDFAPTPAQNHIQPQPAHVSAVADPATNSLESEQTPQPQISVTEDPTLRFEPK
jgi:zinc-ribbon domain